MIPDRQRRLEEEYHRMKIAAKESTILQFATEGAPATRYFIQFSGTSSHADYLNEHELTVWLGLSYPTEPPEVRFVTPIFHPNVPRTGTVSLPKCGLNWDAALTLDRLCERLWDVARYAYIDIANSDNIGNEAALAWFQQQRDMVLPVDGRSLRDAWEIRWGELRERTTPNHSHHSDGIVFLDGDVPGED